MLASSLPNYTGLQVPSDTAVPQFGVGQTRGHLCPDLQTCLKSKAHDLVASTNPTSLAHSAPSPQWEDGEPHAWPCISSHFSPQNPDPRSRILPFLSTLPYLPLNLGRDIKQPGQQVEEVPFPLCERNYDLNLRTVPVEMLKIIKNK